MGGTVVIDYGMGNLRSIGNALRTLGADVAVSAEPEVLARAERAVLPGVGAFGQSMDELRQRGLVEPIADLLASGRPFLGICLGFQVLFDASTEHGLHEGLGHVHGRVERFEGNGLIVPHMGWNRLQPAGPHPLLEGLPEEGAHVYFVHSYRPVGVPEAEVLGRAEYGGTFVAAVTRDNLAGFQFHPEKSGPVGLRLLTNFLAWRPS